MWPILFLLLTACFLTAVVPVLTAGHSAKSAIKVQHSQLPGLWAETFGRENSYFQTAVKASKTKGSVSLLWELLLSQADRGSSFRQSEEAFPFKKYSGLFLQPTDPIFSFDTPERVSGETGASRQEAADDPFRGVRKYQPYLQEELGKVHLAEYTPVLMALMEQESHGKGGDPMQSSESAGLPPNTIKDPKLSIRQGVKHFRRVLLYGEKKRVDFSTIIQAYNMGRGYIDYVAAHGRKNTVGLAKRFSLAQVKKDPQRYNCGDDKQNFRYPYCYGDFTYSTKVSADVVSLVSKY